MSIHTTLFALASATVLGLGATAGGTTSAHAQSAYSYPWCAVYGGGRGTGARSCYYTSWQQCMTTISGVGGLCVQSPYFDPRWAHANRR
jgi:hypothetical protein